MTRSSIMAELCRAVSEAIDPGRDNVPKRYYRAVDIRTGQVVLEDWDHAERFFRNRLWLSRSIGGAGLSYGELRFVRVEQVSTRLMVCR